MRRSVPVGVDEGFPERAAPPAPNATGAPEPAHIAITLPLPPSANKSWRPGVGHNGIAAMFKRAPYKAWLEEARLRVAMQLGGMMIPYRYHARIVLPETPRDPDNHIKQINDALQRGGAIANDKHLRRLVLEVDASREPTTALIELWALPDAAPKRRARKLTLKTGAVRKPAKVRLAKRGPRVPNDLIPF